jgi:hypothetical protein
LSPLGYFSYVKAHSFLIIVSRFMLVKHSRHFIKLKIYNLATFNSDGNLSRVRTCLNDFAMTSLPLGAFAVASISLNVYDALRCHLNI